MSTSSQQQPRRVAYVHDANAFGGMESLQLSMLEHLDTDRYQPYVVIPGYENETRASPQQFVDLLKQAGVTILRPPSPGDTPLLSSMREVRNLIALLRREQIDVVHIQTRHPEAARKATFAAWRADVKVIVRTEHLSPSHQLRWQTRYLVKPFDRMTDCFITDSNADRAEQIRLVGRAASKVLRSYCGIDAHKFNPNHDIAQAKRRIGLRDDLPVIGAVGRLNEQKGHTYLLDAAADVIREYGPVQFVLVGDGQLMDELRVQAERLGIAEHVHFAGFQADYVAYMEAMDIGVMPSLWENFSISMQEFMALGKPMVVTNHASFLEAFTHAQNGLIVPTRDGAALGQGILQLLRDPELAQRLGQAALARVRHEFSIQRHMRDLMNLYDSLLQSGVVSFREHAYESGF